MFYLEFLSIFACFVPVELAIEVNCPADSLVEAQVVPGLLLGLLALVAQHNKYLLYEYRLKLHNL